MLITRLLLVLEVWDGKPTYGKSWAGNNLVWSDLNLGASFKIKRGYRNLKVLITCLLLVLEVCKVKPTYRKSWARNLLMCSDLTLGPSFKVKRGYPNLKVLIARLLYPPEASSGYFGSAFATPPLRVERFSALTR